MSNKKQSAKKQEPEKKASEEKELEAVEAAPEEDPDHFGFTITGITRKEYQQASRLHNRRAYVILLAAMIIFCGVIILATGNASAAAFFGPILLYVIFVVALELMTKLSYKGQLDQVDPVVYKFNPVSWSVTANGQTVEIQWRGTVKLKKTRDCIFIYNDDASSNLLPRRLMTEDQARRIQLWYKDSRILSKQYQQKEMRKEREEWKESHQHLRFGRTGPAWGPWKRDQNGKTYSDYKKEYKQNRGSSGSSKKDKKDKSKK